MVFFFASRRRHTRFDCDWSSDVCSSDLSLDSREYSPSVSAKTRWNENSRATCSCARLPRPSRKSGSPSRRQMASASLSLLHGGTNRSEEHTSELQSQSNLVCRLLLEKKT